MIFWSFISFVVALAAGLVGFGGDSTLMAAASQILFFVSLALAIVLVGVKIARDQGDDRITERD